MYGRTSRHIVQTDRSVILLGPKSSGKSTLFYKLIGESTSGGCKRRIAQHEVNNGGLVYDIGLKYLKESLHKTNEAICITFYDVNIPDNCDISLAKVHWDHFSTAAYAVFYLVDCSGSINSNTPIKNNPFHDTLQLYDDTSVYFNKESTKIIFICTKCELGNENLNSAAINATRAFCQSNGYLCLTASMLDDRSLTHPLTHSLTHSLNHSINQSGALSIY